MTKDRPSMVTFAAVLIFLVGGASLLFGIEVITNSEQLKEITMGFVGDGIVLVGIIYLVIALVALYAGYAILKGEPRGQLLGILIAFIHALVSFLFILFVPLITLIAFGLDVIAIYALIANQDYFE